MMREQALNSRQNQKVTSRRGKAEKQKIKSTPQKLSLTRGKNAKKGQLVNQKRNVITGSVFMPMITEN